MHDQHEPDVASAGTGPSGQPPEDTEANNEPGPQEEQDDADAPEHDHGPEDGERPEGMTTYQPPQVGEHMNPEQADE
jgi:hypothetical protein